MKIIFAGTPEFALPALQALIKSPHTIVAVYTKPDKPAGRGLKMQAPPIKTFALQAGLKVIQPNTLRDRNVQAAMRALNADVLIDVACGFLLPKEVLTMPRLGCINVHPSLLPRWRGAAPIERAILAGDTLTGVTIMQMDEGYDTGAILLQETVLIAGNQLTAGELSEHLAAIGAHLLIFALKQLDNNEIEVTPQDNSQATYAEKITKEETKIDWQKTAQEIERMVRAFNPRPGAYFSLPNTQFDMIKVWEAKPLMETTQAKPGTIVAAQKPGIDMVCGDGTILRLSKLQFPGGKILTAEEVLNARRELFLPKTATA